MLSKTKISENYQLCYQLAETLLAADFQRRGYRSDAAGIAFVELCQSIMGDEAVVVLLQTTRFEQNRYEPVLRTAMDEIKRLLFPDVCKRRYVSLDSLKTVLAVSEPPIAETRETQVPPRETLSVLRRQLTPSAMYYLETHLLDQYPSWLDNLQRWVRHADRRPALLAQAEQRLALMRRFYPDGRMGSPGAIAASEFRSDAEIRNVFLHVYLGILPAFPSHFLKVDGERRAAVMVRCLLDEVLQVTPVAVFGKKDDVFFIRHRLQNVYRYFNYSFNRTLGNAYPEVILPWLNSRAEPQYWEDRAHRVAAVRWLVAQRLVMDVNRMYKIAPAREDFIANGLSYMFNTYYNSVSKALAEAYPDKQPWELGKVPYRFWDAATAAAAVQWMIQQKGWAVASLPEKVRKRELTRKTFSEFGLATLFEKRFSRNIYRAVSAAYPGHFQPWELGKVPATYWEDPAHVFDASNWIADREGIPDVEIVPAIRHQRFTWQQIRRYPIGEALKKCSQGKLERIFLPAFRREYQNHRRTLKLLRKLSLLKQSEKRSQLLDILLHGIFYFQMKQFAMLNEQRYQRITGRIQNRLQVS